MPRTHCLREPDFGSHGSWWSRRPPCSLWPGSLFLHPGLSQHQHRGCFGWLILCGWAVLCVAGCLVEPWASLPWRHSRQSGPVLGPLLHDTHRFSFSGQCGLSSRACLGVQEPHCPGSSPRRPVTARNMLMVHDSKALHLGLALL